MPIELHCFVFLGTLTIDDIDITGGLHSPNLVDLLMDESIFLDLEHLN